MNTEALKAAALAAAARNGGTLTRLANGRWQGAQRTSGTAPGPDDLQIPADIVWSLVGEGKLHVGAKSNGETGFATRVTVANPYAGYQMS